MRRAVDLVDLQKIVLSMMYASESPTLTGCSSWAMLLILIGNSLYANKMSPLECKTACKINTGFISEICETNLNDSEQPNTSKLKVQTIKPTIIMKNNIHKAKLK